MDVLILLIPIAIVLSAAGLAAFFWAMRSGQYDDLEGEAERILYQDDGDEVPRRKEKPSTDDGPGSTLHSIMA